MNTKYHLHSQLKSDGKCALCSGIADSWYLVSVVDNDFVEGDLFAVFDLPQTN